MESELSYGSPSKIPIKEKSSSVIRDSSSFIAMCFSFINFCAKDLAET